MHKFFGLAVICLVACSACTWVELSARGESVRVARPGDAAQCDRLGELTASVLDKVAFMERSRKKQARELETLARNEAAEMGGDTVVSVGDIEDGRRRFTVYQCE